MGFLSGLFGRSRDRQPVATDRCMDCGTTDGGHTDWCPSARTTAPRDTPPPAVPPEAVQEPREGAPGS